MLAGDDAAVLADHVRLVNASCKLTVGAVPVDIFPKQQLHRRLSEFLEAKLIVKLTDLWSYGIIFVCSRNRFTALHQMWLPPWGTEGALSKIKCGTGIIPCRTIESSCELLIHYYGSNHVSHETPTAYLRTPPPSLPDGNRHSVNQVC